MIKKLKGDMVREAVKTEFLLSTSFRAGGPKKKMLEGIY